MAYRDVIYVARRSYGGQSYVTGVYDCFDIGLDAVDCGDTLLIQLDSIGVTDIRHSQRPGVNTGRRRSPPPLWFYAVPNNGTLYVLQKV